MNVISFQSKPCVVITRRSVFETRRETSAGIDIVRHHPPLQAYFIDYTDEDGFSFCVWDGDTRAKAIAVAGSWAAEGVAVRDRTEQSWGRS